MKTTPPIFQNRLFSPLRVLLALTLVLFFSLSAQAALFRVGPLDEPSPPGNGYPLWYQDTNGLVLDLCLPETPEQLNSGLCLMLPADVPNGTPLEFPTNFPGESFWFFAGSIGQLANGGAAELTLALEAAFGGEDPVPGEQVSFGRVRIRIDAPVNGDYTVTFPYGVRQFPGVIAGRRAINMTEDIGIGNPGDFTGALNSSIGPFLRAVNGQGALLPLFNSNGDQFLADPATTPFVTGSPFGTNYFEVCVTPPSPLVGPNGCAKFDQFTLVGKVRSEPVGSPLTVERSTYSRDTNGAAHVEVYATAFQQPGSQAPRLYFGDAGGTDLMPSKLMRGPTDLGLFYGQSIPANGATLPPNVIVTNLGDNPPSSATRSLVDEVKIIGANYNPANGNLTIRATSSDKLAPPTLTVVGLPGSATGSDVMQLDTSVPTDPARYVLVFVPRIGDIPPAANRVPPLAVTVVSSAGGQATEPVVTTVAGGNFAAGGPIAVDDTVSVPAGSVPSVTINVLANDAGSVAGNIVIPTRPQNGTVRVNQATGEITYTFPVPSVAGEETFTYFARNAAGVRSNTATVTVITTTP